MPLTKNQLSSLNNVHGLSLSKIVCIAKAAIKAYKCVKAAGGDISKIQTCATALITDLEACIKKG
jgi:hypothetical protein